MSVQKLHTIQTGLFKLDGGAMFGVVPKSLWNRMNPSDEHNLCTWAMRCLLVETENRLILIDNGIGTKQDEKFLSHFQPHGPYTLEGSLKNAGFHPTDITDVFLTHLHFDHCGGGVKRKGESFELTFPNAVYWTHKDHWESALAPNPREEASFLKENIEPMQALADLRFYEGPSSGLPFEVKTVYGHTEAQMLPLISYKGKKILFCADLIPSIHHIKPHYVMAYDVRPLDTMNEKLALMDENVDDLLLFFEHDPIHELCSLRKGRKWLESNEILRVKDF